MILLLGCSSSTNQDREKKVLVFTKTEGYRHDSILDGVKAIRGLGEVHGFEVKHTEDASYFQDDSLGTYNAVIFMSTSGDVFNEQQQASLKRFVQAGGGVVGIHSATTTEYDWPWFGNMMGGYFDDHPEIQEAVVQVEDFGHPSTQHLPEEWQRTDEWYNYKYLSPDVQVLLNLDETTYEGGTHGNDHPIAWYQDFEGGRVFYTGGGHTSESFTDPLFLEHLRGGIQYVMDASPAN